MSIGERIKAARKQKKVTQNELCERTEMHINSLYKYENGLTSPPFEVISKIAQALGMTIAELVGEKDTRLLGELILIEDLLESKKQELAEVEEKRLNQTATAEEKVKCYELPIEIKAIENIIGVLKQGLYS